MKRLLVLALPLLAVALALVGCPSPIAPSPVTPTPAGTGGTSATGGASQGGETASAGQPGAAGAVSVGGAPTVVVFPTCNETQKVATPERLRELRETLKRGGWHKDRERAKRRKVRPSYSIVAPSVFWQPLVEVALDQGTQGAHGEPIGACTGNATAQCLSTRPFANRLTNADAARIYSRATQIDPWPGTYPPSDTGSNGVSAWRAALDLGYTTIPSTPVETLEELQGALQRSACIVGVDWYEGFFTPTKCGELTQSGAVAGGHEIEIIGWDADLRRVWIRNSWGPNWGVRRGTETGFAYFSAGTFQTLLNRGGEIDCPRSPPANDNAIQFREAG